MKRLPFLISLFLFSGFFLSRLWCQEFVWIEGEDATESKVKRHPWWYDKVKGDDLSGSDWISHWSEEGPGEVTYRFDVQNPGVYEFWFRANPVQARLAYRLNSGEKTNLDVSQAVDSVNVAADGKPDLRFVAWIPAGDVSVKKGANTLTLWFESRNHHHGAVDALVLVKGNFKPNGKRKPGEAVETEPGWVAWDPVKDPFQSSVIDLRHLNEEVAGEHGYLRVEDGRFVRPADGKTVRLWGVNGPPGNLQGEELQNVLRGLAKRGVNLIRIHGAVFDKNTGKLNPEKVRSIQEIVQRAKREGIYTHLSIYFPLWFNPEPGLPFLKGYDGSSHPFASLFINRKFEEHYQGWWRSLLTTPDAEGNPLVNDPALFGLEIINEDSFFFWTFDQKNIPDSQLRILEERFYHWCIKKYGSGEQVMKVWNRQTHPRDHVNAERLGFRMLWKVVNERSARDQDTVQFLAEQQRDFYRRQVRFLKTDLGYKGLVTTSNWHTASARYLRPLELWTYLEGDFIDRHGYFGTYKKGPNVAWSIREGDRFADRSALRFEPREPGKPIDFSHPVADVKVNQFPSMISETAWTRPNRYRTEAPLFYAAYGSLQGTDSIVHFALDGGDWSVKPRFFMQPWTLMSPTQMGQFPATSLIYRLGYLEEGKVLARIGITENDLFSLKGTPLVQEGNLDELRIIKGGQGKPVPEGFSIDPRIHFVGKTETRLGDSVRQVENLEPYILPEQTLLRSSTGQIELNYGKGILYISAPRVQAVSGDLSSAGPVDLGVLRLRMELNPAQVILVSLDGKPLEQSESMLLQVMTEEKATGWKTRSMGNGVYEVVDTGRNPWLFKQINGTVYLKRSDVDSLKVTALDLNGYPVKSAGSPKELKLLPDTVYYLIHK